MAHDRLVGLAMLSIENDVASAVNYSQVLEKFASIEACKVCFWLLLLKNNFILKRITDLAQVVTFTYVTHTYCYNKVHWLLFLTLFVNQFVNHVIQSPGWGICSLRSPAVTDRGRGIITFKQVIHSILMSKYTFIIKWQTRLH